MKFDPKLAAPLVLVEVIIMIVALVDLLRREPERVRGNKILWAAVVIIFGLVGQGAYFLAGRKD